MLLPFIMGNLMRNKTCIIILLWKMVKENVAVVPFYSNLPQYLFSYGFSCFSFFFFFPFTAVLLLLLLLLCFSFQQEKGCEEGNELNKINFREKQSFSFYISNLCENKMEKRRRKTENSVPTWKAKNKKKRTRKWKILVMKAMTKSVKALVK